MPCWDFLSSLVCKDLPKSPVIFFPAGVRGDTGWVLAKTQDPKKTSGTAGFNWFEGKITGKSHISWENLSFPVDLLRFCALQSTNIATVCKGILSIEHSNRRPNDTQSPEVLNSEVVHGQLEFQDKTEHSTWPMLNLQRCIPRTSSIHRFTGEGNYNRYLYTCHLHKTIVNIMTSDLLGTSVSQICWYI